MNSNLSLASNIPKASKNEYKQLLRILGILSVLVIIIVPIIIIVTGKKSPPSSPNGGGGGGGGGSGGGGGGGGGGSGGGGSTTYTCGNSAPQNMCCRSGGIEDMCSYDNSSDVRRKASDGYNCSKDGGKGSKEDCEASGNDGKWYSLSDLGLGIDKIKCCRSNPDGDTDCTYFNSMEDTRKSETKEECDNANGIWVGN